MDVAGEVVSSLKDGMEVMAARTSQSLGSEVIQSIVHPIIRSCDKTLHLIAELSRLMLIIYPL